MAKAKQTVTVTRTTVKTKAPTKKASSGQRRCPSCGKFMNNSR